MAEPPKQESIVDIYSRGREALRLSLETLGVVKIDLYFHDVALSSATGFVYRFADDYFLVTNLHVVGGHNPITDAPLDPRGFVPNRIESTLNVLSDSVGTFAIRSWRFDLLKDGEPIWFEAAQPEPLVDIAVLRLNEILDDYENIKFRIQYIRGGVGLVNFDDKGNPSSWGHTYRELGRTCLYLDFPVVLAMGRSNLEEGLCRNGAAPKWRCNLG
jgi:hypothetical protein